MLNKRDSKGEKQKKEKKEEWASRTPGKYTCLSYAPRYVISKTILLYLRQVV